MRTLAVKTFTAVLGLALGSTSYAAPAPDKRPVVVDTTPKAVVPSDVRAPVATPASWPSWRGDAGQTGRSPSRIGRLVSRWTMDAGEAIVSTAVVDGDLVVFGSKSGKIYALERTTGKLRWSVQTEGAVEAPPLIVHGHVYVGSRDGKLRALAVADGAVSWTHDAKAEITGGASFAPASGDQPAGLVYGAYDGQVHRIDLATGKPRWSYATGSYIYGSPAISGDHALIGGCDGYLHTLRLSDGAAVSKTEVGAYVGASAAWEGTTAWVGHFGNRFLAVDPIQGAVRWTHFDRSFPYLSSPAVSSKLVVVGGRDRVVRALERTTGELWWLFPTRAKVDSSPVIAGDHVLFGAHDGRLYVATLEEGEEVQSLDLGAPVAASPAVAGGWIFVGTEAGTFHALGPAPKKGSKR